MKYFFYSITILLYLLGSFVVGINIWTIRKAKSRVSPALIVGSAAFAFAAILGHSGLTLICSGIGIATDLAFTCIWLFFATRTQSR